jgi:hypothetical protein
MVGKIGGGKKKTIVELVKHSLECWPEILTGVAPRWARVGDVRRFTMFIYYNTSRISKKKNSLHDTVIWLHFINN